MIWCILLAAIGLWLFLEGAAYAAAPEFMRRMAAFLAQQSPRDIMAAGFGSAAVGALLLVIAAQLM